MILNFDTFSIRSWQLSDAESLALNANNPKIAANLMDGFPQPYYEEHALGFINHSLEKNPLTSFTIDVEGKAVGAIGYKEMNGAAPKTAEIGFWLGEAYWGKGIMTKAIAGFIDYGFNLLGLVEIRAEVYLGNEGSKRVLEKNGFKFIELKEKAHQKQGQLVDIWYFTKKKGS